MRRNQWRSPSTGEALLARFLFTGIVLFGSMALLMAVFPNDVQAQQTFKLSLRNRVSSSGGLGFWRVELATADGLPAAKDLTVWCHLDAENDWRKKLTVLQPIPLTLEAGQAFFEKDLYLPKGSWGGTPNFSLDASPRHNRKNLLRPPDYLGNEEYHDMLVIENPQMRSKDMGFSAGRGGMIGENQVYFDRRGAVKRSVKSTRDNKVAYYSQPPKSNTLSIQHRKIAHLPKRWIGYASLEQVVIDSQQFLKLTSDRERFNALRQWVAMGGRLVICDCGEDFSRIPLLMRWLNLTVDTATARLAETDFYQPSDKLNKDWEGYTRNFPSLNPPKNYSLIFGANPAARGNFLQSWQKVSVKPNADRGWKFETTSNDLLHRLGMGRILFHSAAYEDLSEKQRFKVNHLCGAPAMIFSANVLGADNNSGQAYKKWHLINVGVAPTGLFVFVVIAFMTLIGPLGYTYLNVKRKLHYQIWLVPLISTLACLTLLGYAFISEGVGTKLRPTVFVKLDQNRNLASTFGRYSIYSALQPRPYQFRDDQFATLENSDQHRPAVYRWSDAGYKLTGGYASARNVHQVFVATPQETDSRIVVSHSNTEDAVKLTNHFKDELNLLVVKAHGKLYWAEDIAPRQTQTKSTSTDEEFSKSPVVRRFFKELLPANEQEYRYKEGRRYFQGTTVNNPTQWDVGIEQIRRFSSTSKIINNLEDGHYIAIFDSMSEFPSVVPGAREINPRVIVHGKW